MQPDSLDRDFQVFRQSRDPAALAAVFDAAAPRLLLVAMHLCRDAATAEDLVQTVFLQVLRDADRFDARRPVLPWLLAMLEHRASDHRQRAHVRREKQADGDAPPFATSASPERAAADSEVRERVAEALAGMPRDYRDVLALRLVHGLSAVDIAHAHGMPPATVRTRLRRGLELLRGALPRGLATRGLMALLAAELVIARDGMAAVRTKVLAAAAAGTGATFAVGWWLALAACVALAAGGFLWFAPGFAEAPSIVPADASVAVATALTDRGDDSRGRDAGAEQRSAAVLREAANPDVTIVRGRVVDASTGAPLAGVVATMHTSPWETNDAMPDWRDPDPVTTVADGTFVVQFVPSRRRGVELLFAAEGFVEGYTSFAPLRNGVDVDAGDVKLRPGTPVRLRLLCDGRPLGGVQTFARSAPDGGRPGGVHGHGVSDADGIVDLGICEPGPWWHDVRTAHLGNEARFDVPLQREPFVAKVELREPPRDHSISGVLVDTSGTPVAGVELGMPWPSSGTLQATTRTDGRFLWALAVLPPAPVREHIELPRDRRGELEWVDDGGAIAWGTNDLRLVVRRRAPATLRLEVFDAATQQPVEAFGATCQEQVGSCSAESRRVAIEQHAGGIATFNLAPGAYFASVFAAEPFAEDAEIMVQLVEGRTTTLRVPLRPPAELSVGVVDDGTSAPLAGIELVLAKAVPAGRARGISSSWYLTRLASPGSAGTNPEGAVIELARGVSDERGRVSLRAPADVPGLVLIAGGPRCIAGVHHDVVLPAGGAQSTIRVVPAGVVRGVVTPLAFVERFGPDPERLAETAARARTEWTDLGEFADQYPGVVLRPVDGSSTDELTAHVAADGTFSIGGVPAGRYAVHIDGAFGSWVELGPFATVDVHPARVAEPLAIDLSSLVPARGTVRFSVDGAPPRGEGGLARIDADRLRWVTFPLAEDGTAPTPWLLPGTYVPFVATSDRERIFGTQRLVVAANGSVDATFALQRRTVAITISEAAGGPARDVIVRTEAVDHPELGYAWWLNGRTDAEGRLVFTAAPPGCLRLRAFARDQDLRAVDVQPALLLGDVAADSTAATFRMPR